MTRADQTRRARCARSDSIESVLQCVKAGQSIVALDDGLTVQPSGAYEQSRSLGREALHSARLVVAIAGEDARCLVLNANKHPVAIELDLVGPLAGRRKTCSERR